MSRPRLVRSRAARVTALPGVLVAVVALSIPAPASGAVDPPTVGSRTYPDLVPRVAFAYVDRPIVGVDPDTGAYQYGPPVLRFDTWAQNLGTVALDLVADDPSIPTASTASQCISWAATGVCLERRRVGGFSWHDEHTHFHFEDFARYELRKLRGDGAVNYSPGGLLALSEKVSFCLLDFDAVREDAFPMATYTGFCNPFRQGISPGWADIYGPGLPGQDLSVEGLSDGRYALVISLNPVGGLFESDYANNRVEVVVELSGGLTEASIVEQRLR